MACGLWKKQNARKAICDFGLKDRNSSESSSYARGKFLNLVNTSFTSSNKGLKV